MGITKEQIDGIKAKLRNMPDVHGKNISKQAAVTHLSKEIDALKKRGYGIDDIASELTNAGLEISVATLKCYVQRAKPKTEKKMQKKQVGKAKTHLIKASTETKAASAKGTFSTRPDSEEI